MHIQAVAYFRNSEGIVVTNANKLNPAAFDEHEVLFTAPTYGDAQLLRRRLGWNDSQDALDYLAQLLKDKDNHKTQGGHQ